MLDTGTFSQQFVPKRRYAPMLKLEDAGQVYVTVMPIADIETPASRASTQRDIQIAVCVQKRINPDDVGEGDRLMDLLDEIRTALKFISMASAGWIGFAPNPPWVHEQLQSLNQFTAVVVPQYRYIK